MTYGHADSCRREVESRETSLGFKREPHSLFFNNNFSTGNTMTTPPTSSNRYGNTQMNGPYGYYGLGPGGQASQMLPYAFQMFPHQLTYPYLQASQPIYLSYPPPQNIRPLPLPGFGGPEMLRTRHGEDVHRPQPQKI